MKCTNPDCLKEIPEGFKFCPNCGKKVEVQIPVTQTIVTGDKWQNNLPLIGAVLGLVSGLVALIGWFTPWTSLKIGNGPQLFVLPFGISAGQNVLQQYPILSSVISSVDQITGWFLLGSIVLAIISVVLAAMCVLSIWMGIKCLEFRADPSLLPTVKHQINLIGNYSLTGMIFVAIVMVMFSVFQFGGSAIGGGLIAMAFGFIAGFVTVIYLKPHLH